MSTETHDPPREAPKASEEQPTADHNPAPSSFTAVNGRSSPPKPINSAPSPPRTMGTASPSPKDTGPPKINAIQLPTSSQSGTTSMTTSPSIVESLTSAARNETPNSPQTAANSPPRKRSYPEDFESSEQRDPKRPTLPETHESLSASDRDPPPSAKSVYGQPQEHTPTSAMKMEPQQHQRPLSSEYDPLAQTGQNYYPRQDDSDQQMSDHIPRDSEESNNRPRYNIATPDGEEPPRHHMSGEYSRTSGVQVDQDRKRRKRVFSNRTKTGCMTCRKRKKKLHPECNNCLRGGFVCEGYTVRNAWGSNPPKQQTVKAPIALQSKPVAYSSPQHHPRYPEVRDYPAASNPELPRIEDPHRDMSRISPSGESRSAHPYNNPPHPYPQGPPQHHSPHQRYDRPLHSAHENVHEPPETSNPYPASSAPPVHPHSGPPHSAHSHHGSLSRTSSIHHPAVLAPSHDQPSTTTLARRPTGEMTEREKMLRGDYYLPYTPALIADREQCSAAVWRFNNSTNPTMGIPPEDRMRFFRQIVELRPTHDASVPPRGPHDPPPDPQYTPNGRIGPGVVVEAPFHCDYGYNITIGSDVVIGPDCRISDTCAVTIGDNVVFSPGVKLVCATYAIDPKERRKGKGRALGRNIVIEDDAWIGSNVTVLPGVRVGRCSTVGAGSLLHKDVPPYTVVAGNPPKVVRGIYEDGRT